VIAAARSIASGLALLALAALAPADEAPGPGPVIPRAVLGERCVEPVAVMRREHMHLLLHQRDETVHRGIRGARHSLVGCIACHAQKDDQGAAIPVNAEGQFCASCHRFAGVRVDCFECHAAVPVENKARGTLAGAIAPPQAAAAGAQ